MSAKYNSIIKFSLSLKMKKKKQGPVPPPKMSIFCSTHFLCDLQKNTRNKHIFEICDLQVLFKMFFSKMYNKEKLFIAVRSP